MDLPFRRLRDGAALPSAQHPGDAGLDLRAAEAAVVAPGERAMVPTGVAVAIPEGHAGLVLPRSGLASKHGLTLANAPGLIDAGYQVPVRPVTVGAGVRVRALAVEQIGCGFVLRLGGADRQPDEGAARHSESQKGVPHGGNRNPDWPGRSRRTADR